MSFDHYLRGVMSGAARGPAAACLRAALAAAEPVYAAAVRRRNRAYDEWPAKSRALPRPVVSIGNLTAGGTGKTPIVRWLASRLRDEGRHVAVLSRGYKAAPGTLGDEQRMLDRLLNGGDTGTGAGGAAGRPRVIIRADPDRFAAGTAALRDEPRTDVFVLDDGFQHRRVRRALDVVLLNATEPFGFGHVLPRGLLREPMDGLRRAGAVVLTHAASVGAEELSKIEQTVRRYNADAPIYRTVHAPAGLRTAGASAGAPPDVPLDALRGRRAFAFCGLGSPSSFERAVRSLAGACAGHAWFADHHDYTAADVARVRSAARAAGADVLVTTEKDWVKLSALSGAADDALPLWRLDVVAQFIGDDEAKLLAQVRGVL